MALSRFLVRALETEALYGELRWVYCFAHHDPFAVARRVRAPTLILQGKPIPGSRRSRHQCARQHRAPDAMLT